jgi:Flp pilus assembly protein TadD
VVLTPRPVGDQVPVQLTATGWQLWQAGKLAKAAQVFDEAVRLHPSDANAWNGLGWTQFNGGDLASAEESFRKAVEINPELPGALNGLGQIFLSQRKYAEAEKFLLQAAPQAPAAWFGLARLYLLQDRFEDAEIWARKVVDSGQGDDFARQMLAAAKARRLDDSLRQLIEPPPAS